MTETEREKYVADRNLHMNYSGHAYVADLVLLNSRMSC